MVLIASVPGHYSPFYFTQYSFILYFSQLLDNLKFAVNSSETLHSISFKT